MSVLASASKYFNLCRLNLYKFIWSARGMRWPSDIRLIYPYPKLSSEPSLIFLGRKVCISAEVHFVTHDGGYWVPRNIDIPFKGDSRGEIKIGDNVFIGIKTIILPRVTVGDNVIIAAGSVVTKNIPANSVWGGVPARRICSIEEYVAKHNAL